MKKVYCIFEQVEETLCAPYNVYYAREDNWQTTYITYLKRIEVNYATEEEAIAAISGRGPGDYVVLPVYSVRN